MCSSGTNQRDSGSEVCLGFVVEKLLDIMDVHTPEIEHQHGCGLKPWYPDGTLVNGWYSWMVISPYGNLIGVLKGMYPLVN